MQSVSLLKHSKLKQVVVKVSLLSHHCKTEVTISYCMYVYIYMRLQF